MELAHNQILVLANALRNLDGTKDQGVYKFNAKTRYALAKNLRHFQSAAEDINRVRLKMNEAARASGEELKEGSPASDKLVQDWLDFLKEKSDVPGAHKFNLSELQLDTNQIPVSVLCDLGPLIIDEAPIESIAQ